MMRELAYVLVCGIGVLSYVLAWRYFREGLLEPYMDEKFHVAQAELYCKGHFDDWDPKITTLPGLYLVAAAFSWASGLSCSLSFLRSINVVFNAISFVLMWKMYSSKWRNHLTFLEATAHAATLSLYPVHFFFGFMFYTDSGATCFTLLYLWLSDSSTGTRGMLVASLTGCLAILFRQTSVVWCLFGFATACLKDLVRASAKKEELHESVNFCGPLTLTTVLAFLFTGIANAPMLLSKQWHLLIPLALFTVFMVKNGGSVAVGDKEHHEFSFHTAQLCYFSIATATMHPASTLLDPRRWLRFLSCIFHWVKAFPIRTFALLVASLLLLHIGTVCHPFILSDNRHYTFYIWKRWLGRSAFHRLVLFPGYAYTGWLSTQELKRGGCTPLWILMFVVCTSLVLVPTPLMEPRYWTIPLLVVHLNATPNPWPDLVAKALGCVIINIVTFHMFFNKSFIWPDNSTARFMW